MKNLKKSAYLFLTFLTPFGVFGQDEIDSESASISTEFCVSLSTTFPVANFYKIDISHIAFIDAIDAQNKFGYIANNLVSYKYDLGKKEAIIELHLDRTTEPKDVIWWSEYLSSLCGL